MSHPEYFLLGKIHKTHGVKGDFSISLDTDSPSRYKSLKLVYLEVGDTLKEYDVTKINVKEKERSAIIHLSGIEDMTTAENYLKFDLYLPLSSLPKLRGKKFYFHEIIGMIVNDVNYGELGPITNVYELPHQPVAEFKFKDKLILFPLMEVFIKRIDREEKIFYTELPDGTIEVYDDEK